MSAKTTNAQKAIAGTLRPCRTNPAEGKVVVGVNIDATTLSPRARGVLPQFLDTLIPTGRLTADTWPAFVRLLETYAEIEAASAAIEKAGGEYYETVNEKTGGIVHRVHPAVAVRAAADKRFAKYAENFGLTPASRMRAAAVPAEPEKINPFQDL